MLVLPKVKHQDVPTVIRSQRILHQLHPRARLCGHHNTYLNQPEKMGLHNACLQGWAPPPVPLHGPNFRSLSNAHKKELVRIHANLGHPSLERLATHLAATGADETIVRAARDYVRDACVESAQPTIARPGKLHEPTEFNQVLGIDGFFWKGRAGIQVYVVHFIDECSCFHLGRRVESRHTSAALPAFQESWMSWAGAPREIYLDSAGQLRSTDMWTALQSLNIQAFVTSEAWQRGCVERHGQVIKQMLTRLDQEVAFSTIEEIDTALLQCVRAKNFLVRHQGYSPEQIVLGTSTALPASICSDESCSAHSLAIADGLEADKFRASLDLRARARSAFLNADNSDALRRAALRRTRPVRGPFLQGQCVLYWIKRPHHPNRQAAACSLK